MRHRLHLSVAIAAAGLATAAGAFAPSASVGRAHPTVVKWQLIGAGRDGRSIVVIPRSLATCDQGHVDVAPVAVSNGTATVSLTLPNGPSTTPCAFGASVTPPVHGTYVLPTGAPIRGLRITGDGRVSSPIDLTQWWRMVGGPAPQTTPPDVRPPRLVGLRVRDARSILASLGETTRHITIHGPRDGYVVKQDPPVSGVFTPGTAVSLTTAAAS